MLSNISEAHAQSSKVEGDQRLFELHGNHPQRATLEQQLDRCQIENGNMNRVSLRPHRRHSSRCGIRCPNPAPNSQQNKTIAIVASLAKTMPGPQAFFEAALLVEQLEGAEFRC